MLLATSPVRTLAFAEGRGVLATPDAHAAAKSATTIGAMCRTDRFMNVDVDTRATRSFLVIDMEEAMRQLISKMSISLDGFGAGPNGEPSWLFETVCGGASMRSGRRACT